MRCRRGRREKEKCTLRIGRGLGSGRAGAAYSNVCDGRDPFKNRAGAEIEVENGRLYLKEHFVLHLIEIYDLFLISVLLQ